MKCLGWLFIIRPTQVVTMVAYSDYKFLVLRLQIGTSHLLEGEAAGEGEVGDGGFAIVEEEVEKGDMRGDEMLMSGRERSMELVARTVT